MNDAVTNKKNESPYDGLVEALLRLVSRSGKDATAEQSEALHRMLDELGNIESTGGLCIEWNKARKKDVDAITACGLLSPTSSAKITPFVLDKQPKDLMRLYSRRNYFIEKRLGEKIAQLFSQKRQELKANVSSLDHIGNSKEKPLTEEQRTAASNALGRPFAVICGGPGTGKTTTVAKYLEAALTGKPDATIVLCAPTGKAQSRLNEEVRDQINKSKDDYKLLYAAEQSGRLANMTIHKLLVTNRSDGLKPSAEHPLECDILVVDEGSMVEVPLGLRLMSVIDPKKTQVLFLGDKHQLAAVGPGSLFADLSDQNGPLKACVKELTKNHRFDEKSKIGNVAKMLATAEPGDKEIGENILFLLDKNPKEELALHKDHPNKLTGLSTSAKVWLDEHLKRYVKSVNEHLIGHEPSEDDLEAVWGVLSTFRPLAAQRKGPMSLEAINRYAEEFVKKQVSADSWSELYSGKVIIVRKNDSNLGVSNGDVAIIYKKKIDGKPTWFAYIGDLAKSIRAQLLPEYDVAFGMTIHQSQGSGFDDVAVFLPYGEGESKNLATRELLYTGITRAKKTCQIFGSKESFLSSVETVTSRQGGLSDRITEALKR